MSTPLPCTRLLLSGSLTADLSQHEADLVSLGAGAYEGVSARAALDGEGDGRSLELRLSLSTASEGVALDHGTDVGAQAYRLTVLAGGGLELGLDGLTVASEAMPDVVGSPRLLIVRWATEPNPQSTGPADALRSELHVFNVETERHLRRTLVHATPPASDVGTLSVGGVRLGGVLTSPLTDGVVEGLRINAVFQTATATREHWLGPSPAPALEEVSRVEQRHPPAALAEHGQVAGPLYAAAVTSVQANSHRLVSRLTSGALEEPPTLQADLSQVYSSKWVSVDAQGWSRCPAWMWRRRVPRHCDLILVRLQGALWSATPDPPGKLEVRAVISSHPPGWQGDEEALLESAELERTTDDGPQGVGDQLDFDALPVVRNPDGESWMWLEFRVAEGAADSHTRFSIRAWSWLATAADKDFDLILEDFDP